MIEHHVSGANPGMVGLAISYALGITGKLSGLVTTFTGSFHTDRQKKERNQARIQIQRPRGNWLLWSECSNTSTGSSLSRWVGGNGSRVRVFQLTRVEGLNTAHISCCLLQVEGTITSPYHWPSEGIVTLKNVKLRFPIKRLIP